MVGAPPSNFTPQPRRLDRNYAARVYEWCNDGSQSQAGLIRNRSGVLYGTASSGGNGSAGVVFQLCAVPYDPTSRRARAGWKLLSIVLHRGQDGDGPDTGLVFDQAGNLDGAAGVGGSGWGLVYQPTPGSSGWTESVLYAFTGRRADGRFPNRQSPFDSTGNLHGTTVAGGAGCGVVYQIAAQRQLRRKNEYFHQTHAWVGLSLSDCQQVRVTATSLAA